MTYDTIVRRFATLVHASKPKYAVRVTVHKSTETTQSTKNLNLCSGCTQKSTYVHFCTISKNERRKHNSIGASFYLQQGYFYFYKQQTMHYGFRKNQVSPDTHHFFLYYFDDACFEEI